MKNNLVDIAVSKELIDLEKIKRAHIAIFPDKRKEDGSLYTETEFEEEFNSIENALEEHEQYKAIEKKLGLPLKVWVYLVQKELIEEERIYVENSVDDEKEKQFQKQLNGRPQRFILWVDFEEKFIQLQGSEDWCEMPFKDYGKTWALTKGELKKNG